MKRLCVVIVIIFLTGSYICRNLPGKACDRALRILSGRSYVYLRSGYVNEKPAIYIIRKENAEIVAIYNGYVSTGKNDGTIDHCRCSVQQFQELLQFHPEYLKKFQAPPM